MPEPNAQSAPASALTGLAPDEPATCGNCGCVSTWRAMFAVVRTIKGSRSLCPACQEIRREQSGMRTWMLAVSLIVAIPLLDLAGVSLRYLWIALCWAWFVIASYMSVLPHEWGHALMARAVGYRPLAIIWGGQRHVFDRTIFGVRTLISRAPESGLTFYEPTDERSPLLRQAAVTAAGPMVNVLLASIAFVLAWWIDAPFRGSYLKSALMMFACANAFMALHNLWPMQVKSLIGTHPSDGMKLWNFINRKSGDLAESRAAACFIRIHFAHTDEAYDEVLAEADAAERFVGLKAWIDVARSAALCGLDRPAEAHALLGRVLRSEDKDIGSRALAENNSAWALFTLGARESDAEALERSSRAHAVLAWLPPVMITRACVLATWAQAGSHRLKEAETLLARARKMRPDLKSRMTIAVAYGLIAAAQGDAEGARRQLQAARAMGNPGLAGRVLEARLPSP